jgi:hypothetical protein
MILGTQAGRECCIAEQRQSVRHRVVQSGFSDLDQLVFQSFLLNIVADNGDLNIIY